MSLLTLHGSVGEWRSEWVWDSLVFYMPSCGNFCAGVSYDWVFGVGVGVIGLELGMMFTILMRARALVRDHVCIRFR